MKRHKFLIFVLLFNLLAFSLNPVGKLFMKAVYPLRYEDIIYKYCDEYGLDEFLVMALIKAESNYICDAHSGIARGLMQITDDTAVWIAKKLSVDFLADDIENPETNISMGCFYLSYLLDYYADDEALALAAYNAGLGNVNKWLSNEEYSKDGKTLDKIPFEETRIYIEKIEKNKEIYISLYKNKEE